MSWPGGRRWPSNSWPAIAWGAVEALIYSRSLLNTLLPQFGTGTPTRTRASAQTFLDFEGILRTAPAGCMAPTGMRFVRNLWPTNTEDLTASANNFLSATVDNADYPTGTSKSTTTVTNGAFQQFAATTKLVVGHVYAFRVWAKGAVGGESILGGDESGTGTLSVVTTGWALYSRVFTAAGTTAVMFSRFTGQTVKFSGLQFVEITGASDQTSIPEYQSVGVLSAPYQGLGADGCAAYATKLDGTPIAAALMIGGLDEGAASNVCLQSENFGTTWTVVGTPTRVAASKTCGSLVLDLLGDDDAGVLEYFQQAIVFTGDGVKAISLHIAQGTSTSSVIRVRDNTSTATVLVATITWVNGVPSVAMTTGTFSGMETLANGVYRLKFATVSLTAADSISLRVLPATNAGNDATLTGTLYAGGVQAENAAISSSYKPTTTTAFVGAADVDSAPTSGNINAAQGSIYLEFTPQHAPSGTIAEWGTYTDGTHYFQLAHNGTSYVISKRNGGSAPYAFITAAYAQNVTDKVLFSWGASGLNVYVNGVKGTGDPDTTPAIIANTMQVGADGNGGQQPFGNIRNFRIFQNQLSDAAAIALTTP